MTGIRPVAVVLAVAFLAACASTAQRDAEQARIQKLAETKAALGGTYLASGQLEIAKEELDQALELAPDDSQVNSVMGLLQWKLRNFKDAERYFQKSIDIDPQNAATHYSYGSFLCDAGRIDDGVQQLEKAANDPLYPYAADANLNAGLCVLKKGSFNLAAKYFREALQVNPQLPRALYEMAKLSFNSGDVLAARGFIQRYFAAGPETPGSLFLATHIERALRNRDAEANYAVRLHDKFPDSPEAAQLAKEYMGTNVRN